MSFWKRAGTTPISLPPRPISLAPSGTYDGDDGKWSTFNINVAGDGEGKGQNFKVLISTALPMTLVPATSEWCDVQCSKSRGVTNDARGLDVSSPLYKFSGLYALPFSTWPWWSQDLLSVTSNDTLNGEWGLTTVGLGSASKQSITIQNQYVATSTLKDFFLGYLGLSVGEISPGGARRPTYFSGLAQVKDYVSSPSYGFTAGAPYRNNLNGVTGNMVFGGYDGSRLLKNQGVSIAMPNKQNNTLAVGVQSIVYKPNANVEQGSTSFTNSGGFSAVIDSTLPYLVLPTAICDKFVEKFNLRYDNATNLYTINSTAHERNGQQNATVMIKIGESVADSAKSTTITFPYAAFYLEANPPFAPNKTNYFPIRASKNGMFILGRSFLQEAYLIVDYERANFTVAPAAFSNPMPNENLITIYNTSYELPLGNGDDSGNDGLGAGAIAGIVVGIVAAFLIFGVGGFFYYKRRRNNKVKVMESEEKPPGVDTVDTIAIGNEKDRRASELTGSEPYSPQTKPVGYYGGDRKVIPELSPDSPPAELYSPPLDNANGIDYFASAPKPRRRGATRDSSGNNTPGTPPAELAGDDGRYQVAGQHFEAVSPVQRPKHNRGASDNSMSTNIDEVIAGQEKDTVEVQRKRSSRFVEHTDDNAGQSRAEMVVSPLENTRADERDASVEPTIERRPSHTRGLSDTTVNSDSTAVSQPTPEEIARWNETRGDTKPTRPLSN